MLVEKNDPPIKPPKGRRPWIIPEFSGRHGLRYLSWGKRRFGREPLPVIDQAGYVYFLLLRGRATLELPAATLRLNQGGFFILHPSLPMGLSASRGGEQEILCWIWRDAPQTEPLRPLPGAMREWRVNRSLALMLQLHHRSLRSELVRHDAFTPLAIAAKRTELDILLARELTSPSHASRVDRAKPRITVPPLLQQAADWIRSNPGAQRPVADLCDRFDISSSRLARLCREHLQTTPLEMVNRAKVDFARTALAAGSPVKAVAYDLGYRHAHDFTRFYRLQTGLKPSAK